MTVTLRRRVPSLEEDRGTTLVELLVAMGIMTVFMAIFTGAVLSMTRTVTKVEAETSASGQVHSAFLSLGRLVRYATAITTPGVSPTSGDWYVELRTVNGDPAVETCTQLRVDVEHQRLEKRTWQPSTQSSDLHWLTVASGVVNGGAAPGSSDQPFAEPAALEATSTSLQRLTVNLTTTGSGAGSHVRTHGTTTFVALNSTPETSSTSACHTPPGEGYRP